MKKKLTIRLDKLYDSIKQLTSTYETLAERTYMLDHRSKVPSIS